MKKLATDLIVKLLLAGHSVTFFSPFESDLGYAYRDLEFALHDLCVRPVVEERGKYLELAGGAFVRFMPLTIRGASCLHTPVLVFRNLIHGDANVYREARYVACPFPDGSPPLILEF